MAINYTNLFGDLGEIYMAISEIESLMATAEARRLTMITQFDNSGVGDMISNINSTFSLIQDSLNGSISNLLVLAQARLTERETVLEQLIPAQNSGFQTIMRELIVDMIANSETVKESLVRINTFGTDTLSFGVGSSTNTNVGILLTSLLLPGDGTSLGSSGFKTTRSLRGTQTQLTLDDSIDIVCTADSQGGTAQGSERFVATGKLPPQPQSRPFELNQGGNRGNTTLTAAGQGNLINNFFEDFNDTTDANLPDDWEIIVGTTTTDYIKHSVTPMLGSNAFQVNAGSTVTIRYDLSNGLTPAQVMGAYLWAKRPTAAGTGDITVELIVGGVTVFSEAVGVQGSTWDDNEYHPWGFTFIVPDDLGDDGVAYLELQFTSSVITIVDGGGLNPLKYHAGIGMLVIPGPEKFILDDKFSINVSNNDAGKFQRLFTRSFGWQLPSATSGSETITEPS